MPLIDRDQQIGYPTVMTLRLPITLQLLLLELGSSRGLFASHSITP